MNWQLTSWEVEFLKRGIYIVGYIYNHPKFKDGEKVCIKIPGRMAIKYKYMPFFQQILNAGYGHKVL